MEGSLQEKDEKKYRRREWVHLKNIKKEGGGRKRKEKKEYRGQETKENEGG